MASDHAFSLPVATAQGIPRSRDACSTVLGAIGSISGKNLPFSTVVNPKLVLTLSQSNSL